jgi:hypothetical protein
MNYTSGGLLAPILMMVQHELLLLLLREMGCCLTVVHSGNRMLWL